MKKIQNMTFQIVKRSDGLMFCGKNINGKSLLNDEPVNPGEILASLSNFYGDLTSSENTVRDLFIIKTKINNSYFANISEQLNKFYGQIVADIILVDLWNYFESNEKNIYSAIPIIGELRSECFFAFIFVGKILMNNLLDLKEKEFLADLSDLAHEDRCSEIRYDIQPRYVENKLYIDEIFYTKKCHEVILLTCISAIQSGINIKLCFNCHKAFIPLTRSDEIYCNNFFKGNKTCKQIGYEAKINNDEFLKAYRTAYKTKNAFKNRNLKNNPHAEEQFNNWVKQAKEELGKAQAGDIALDEFRHWLKS
jgi:hypothetical protein